MNLYNQNNLAIAKIADKNKNRPEISGVLFEKNKTVATDSFRLIEMSTPKSLQVSDYPEVTGRKAIEVSAPFIISAEVIKQLKIPKKSPVDILKTAAVLSVDGKTAEFITTDLTSTAITPAPITEGQYPDYKKIYPEGAPVAEVLINASYLSEVLDILGKLDEVSARVRLKFYGKDKPLVLEASNSEQEARAMVMGIIER